MMKNVQKYVRAVVTTENTEVMFLVFYSGSFAKKINKQKIQYSFTRGLFLAHGDALEQHLDFYVGI